MRLGLLAAVIVASGSLLAAQETERKVPKDSARVTLRGCANGRTFIVGPRSEDSPGTLEIEPGRRFRLNGPRKLLAEIKLGEKRMVQVTGLIRRADLEKPGGVSIAGGRVRVGGADPRAPVGNPATQAVYSQAVIDVESSLPLPDPCPAR